MQLNLYFSFCEGSMRFGPYVAKKDVTCPCLNFPIENYFRYFNISGTVSVYVWFWTGIDIAEKRGLSHPLNTERRLSTESDSINTISI